MYWEQAHSVQYSYTPDFLIAFISKPFREDNYIPAYTNVAAEGREV